MTTWKTPLLVGVAALAGFLLALYLQGASRPAADTSQAAPARLQVQPDSDLRRELIHLQNTVVMLTERLASLEAGLSGADQTRDALPAVQADTTDEMPPVGDQPGTGLSEADVLQAEAERFGLLDARLHREPIDADWAAQATAAVEVALLDTASEVRIDHVDCRTRVCRVALQVGDEHAPDMVVTLLPALARSFPKLAVHSVGDEGARTLYLGRDERAFD